MKLKKRSICLETASNGGYEEIAHTADLCLRVWGKTLPDLFINAARGMNALMWDTLDETVPVIHRFLSLEGIDTEDLLVTWLTELAFLAESENVVFSEFHIGEMTTTSLIADLTGQCPAKPTRSIKAVTYHNLKIQKTQEGMEVTVIFDV